MARKRHAKSQSSKPEEKVESKKEGSVPEKEELKEPSDKAQNDPAWYSRDERLLIDSASIPFSIPFGSELKMDTAANPLTSGKIFMENVSDIAGRNPGIMVFRMNPSYGASTDSHSPMNVAANAIYSHVRYVNNGRKNYDPADLFIYLAAVTEMYSYVTWLRRIYGCAFPYSQANWYLGKAMLQAQGVNPDDLIANLANFRYRVNAFLNKVAAYAIPADVALIFKKAFMYGSAYLEHEGESVKDQIYMYTPATFYQFVLDYQQKGALKRVVVPDTYTSGYEKGLTVDQLLQIGEDLISNIWGDEDFGLMSGDILRAFQGNIVKLESLPEDFWTIPVHDKLVLTQMENTTIFAARVDGDPTTEPDASYFTLDGDVGETKFIPGCIMQSGSGLLVNMETQAEALGTNLGKNYDSSRDHSLYEDDMEVAYDKILNIHDVTGDPATVIESIQNMVGAKTNAIGGEGKWRWSAPYTEQHMLVANTGAYFCSQCIAWVINPRDTAHDGLTPYAIHQNFDVTVSVEFVGAFPAYIGPKLKVALNFKYCPKLFFTQGEIRTGGYAFNQHELMGRLDTYAQISNETLGNMIETSLLSLLYVPGVAKYVNALS